MVNSVFSYDHVVRGRGWIGTPIRPQKDFLFFSIFLKLSPIIAYYWRLPDYLMLWNIAFLGRSMFLSFHPATLAFHPLAFASRLAGCFHSSQLASKSMTSSRNGYTIMNRSKIVVIASMFRCGSSLNVWVANRIITPNIPACEALLALLSRPSCNYLDLYYSFCGHIG